MIIILKRKICRAVPSITKKGIKVKSKSEKRIADVFTIYNIDYIYEPALEVGKYTFLPDFYLPILNIYVEYFGLINDKEYCRKTRWKRKMYRIHGFKLISVYPRHIYRKSNLQIIRFFYNAFKYYNTK